MGYHRAGFDVCGVDIEPKRRYPFAFHMGDAVSVMAALLAGQTIPFTQPDGSVERFELSDFDAIHASPPCQGYSSMRHAPGAKGAPLMIDAVRDVLQASRRPWIIENVEEAAWAMRSPLTLCGSMFGLGSQGCRLQRHRLFESNTPLSAPIPCRHDERPVVGVYGGHARKRAARAGGRGTRDVWEGGHKAAASEALGIDWMTLNELSEAIPPAYTHHIGQHLADHIRRGRGLLEDLL